MKRITFTMTRFTMSYVVRGLLFAVVALTLGCDSHSSSDVVRTATGETPVRYVFCSGSSRCLVLARFVHIESCEAYKKKAAWDCDEPSSEMTLMCRKNPATDVSRYCIY